MMADTRQQVKGNILYYKNKPLVREKDTICYGDFSEKCVLIFEIMSYVENEGTKVPGKIFIQVLESETGKILKQTRKACLKPLITVCSGTKSIFPKNNIY